MLGLDMRIRSETIVFVSIKRGRATVSVADGIRGGREVVRILNCLSLHAWSDFLFEIQQALKICRCAPSRLGNASFSVGMSAQPQGIVPLDVSYTPFPDKASNSLTYSKEAS